MIGQMFELPMTHGCPGLFALLAACPGISARSRFSTSSLPAWQQGLGRLPKITLSLWEREGGGFSYVPRHEYLPVSTAGPQLEGEQSQPDPYYVGMVVPWSLGTHHGLIQTVCPCKVPGQFGGILTLEIAAELQPPR